MSRTGIASRSFLAALAVGFILSGALRVLEGAGPVLAQDMLRPPGVEEATCTCTTDDGLAEALAAIRAREARVSEQEDALIDRLAALELAEQAIAARLKALQDAEVKLRATMAQSATAAEDDLEQLTSVYENMKPKEAARLFEAMTPEFAAGFLSRMRADSAAAVMAGLPPESAYSISVILAGRNARAPTQ